MLTGFSPINFIIILVIVALVVWGLIALFRLAVRREVRREINKTKPTDGQGN
jgi:uncharacterized membrane protein YcjF (UPF0283 family)